VELVMEVKEVGWGDDEATRLALAGERRLRGLYEEADKELVMKIAQVRSQVESAHGAGEQLMQFST
jgi:hypothetical protein